MRARNTKLDAELMRLAEQTTPDRLRVALGGGEWTLGEHLAAAIPPHRYDFDQAKADFLARVAL